MVYSVHFSDYKIEYVYMYKIYIYVYIYVLVWLAHLLKRPANVGLLVLFCATDIPVLLCRACVFGSLLCACYCIVVGVYVRLSGPTGATSNDKSSEDLRVGRYSLECSKFSQRLRCN